MPKVMRMRILIGEVRDMKLLLCEPVTDRHPLFRLSLCDCCGVERVAELSDADGTEFVVCRACREEAPSTVSVMRLDGAA